MNKRLKKLYNLYAKLSELTLKTIYNIEIEEARSKYEKNQK